MLRWWFNKFEILDLMRVSLTFLVLLLFLFAGCEKEIDLADRLPESSIELTDGYCLVAGDQVVVNHYDISYYDYGAHVDRDQLAQRHGQIWLGKLQLKREVVVE